MKIDRNTLVFLDASCLIAAAGSPTGGSGFLLSLCARGLLKAAVSQPVLLEALSNIQKKLGAEAVRSYHNLLTIIPFSLAPIPEQKELKRLTRLINKKDVHVVAAAMEVHALFLLSLDKGLLLEINKANLGISALLPGDFIKTILPRHVDYESARD